MLQMWMQLVVLCVSGFEGFGLELEHEGTKWSEPNGKWTCEAAVNSQGNGMSSCKATENLQKVNVDNNGWCEAARNSHWKEVSGLESHRKEVTGLESHNTTSSFLVKPFDLVKYDMVRKNDLEVEYDLVKENDIKLKYDIVTKNDLVKLVHKELNGDSGVQATSYLRLEKFENKSLSMCLVKGVFETMDAEIDNFAVFDLEIKENVFLEFLAGMNKDYAKKWLQWIAVLFDFDFNLEYVFKVMVVLTRYGSPTMDYMVHFLDVINYFGYYVQKMFLVLVDVGLAWQSLCLTMWWLLSPHSGLGWLQLVSCLSDVAGGQVFQMAVVALMVSSWIGIMATSNMNLLRHVATPEHMSRVEKRRKKRVICTMRKQFISVMFICSCSSAAAMEQDAMLQRIISLTEAATRAALSAEQTLNQVQGMTSSATSSSEGLQAASRILKAPDTFNGDDPMQFASWRFQFTSWLTFGDTRYTTLLEKVEAMTTSPSIASYDTSEKELAHKLYAVLTRPLRQEDVHTSSRLLQSPVMVLQFGTS